MVSNFNESQSQSIQYNIVIMLSQRCNMRCSYCIEGAKDDNKIITFDGVTNQLSHFSNNIVVELTGGEPLLHTKLIKKIIDWAYEQKKECRWILTTNGSILPSENFIDNYITRFHLVRLSIDGPSKCHDINRGTGSFDRAMRFLEALHQRGYRRILLNPTFTKHTIRYLRSSAQWFLDIQKKYDLPCLNLTLNVADRTDWTEEDLMAISESPNGLFPYK